METKSNNGKNIFIVILILLIFGIGGFTIYKEYINNNEIDKLNNKIEELDKKLQSSNNPTAENQTSNSIFGYYKHGRLSSTEITCVSDKLEETTEISLLDNGTFISQYQSNCSKVNQTGDYTYNNNKITLKCDPNKSEQCDGTPSEYILNENGSITLNDNSDVPVIFTKINKNELQLLK